MNKQSCFERNPKKTISFVLIFIFIFIFIAIESYLRITKEDSSEVTTTIKYDSIDGFYKYKKNDQFSIENEKGDLIQIHTNKYGFRNDNKIYGEDREKVIVLGDSFIANLNTSFERSLTELLNQKTDKYAFINAGVGAYSNFNMLQALKYLLNEGIIPQKVLCFIYLGNDLRDNYIVFDKINNYKQFSNVNKINEQNTVLQENFIQKIKKVGKKSELITLIYSSYNKIGLKPDKYTSYFYGEAELYKINPNEEFYSRALESTQLIIKLFKDIAQQYRFDLYFVLIPSKAQVYNEFKFISKYNETENADEYLLNIIREGYNFNGINASFSEIIAKYNLESIDLTNSFKKEISNGNKLFYLIDLHWNNKGQEITSDIIYNQLISKW
ncbi:MAG: hypothetical protein HF978_04715 [Desulfobacteraceae bacterium]|nr:hypothetical protein [Desulfobacteraceae bacterium]MBC2754832.1 hypothetical protein [Desulfobacteraceae bacterium]